MEETEYYVLAMYDIRGKQEYIFCKNQIKEIVGGSCIIRDCFETYLYKAARKYVEKEYKKEQIQSNQSTIDIKNNPLSEKGIYSYNKGEKFRTDDVEQFEKDNFKKHLLDGYVGEVVYDGGGNFLVLYKNETVCKEINKIFTRQLLAELGTLKVLCTYVKVSKELDNYLDDRNRLYEKHRINESQESVIRPVNSIPFIQMDSMTSMPLTKMWYWTEDRDGQKIRRPEKMSTESFAKNKKYLEVSKDNEKEYGEKVLDNLVKKKGEDSLLAVIFIDGNNMGAKVMECLKPHGESLEYETAVNELRKFSKKIQNDYVDMPMQAIDCCLEQKYKEETDMPPQYKRRFVVYAGDEMSFVCRAEDAWEVVSAYFDSLPKGASSCAGIAVFHSHAPYAQAYRIAEECCESGKQKMKKENLEGTCFVDYHYCQGGMGMELDEIRSREQGSVISKPWLFKDNSVVSPKEQDEISDSTSPIKKNEIPASIVTKEQVEKAVMALSFVNRTNIKGLAERAMSSLADFDMEMSRIYAHQSQEIAKKIEIMKKEEPEKLKKIEAMEQAVKYIFKELQGEERRNLIYDIVIAYDLWFKDINKQNKEEKNTEGSKMANE